jgi:hypothetical protein
VDPLPDKAIPSQGGHCFKLANLPQYCGLSILQRLSPQRPEHPSVE